MSVCPSSYVFHNFKHLLLRNRLPDQSQILCGASLGRGNKSLFAASGSHDQDGRHAHTSMRISTKLGMYHRGLQPIIVCSNDDPGLTLTYYTARSNLVTQKLLQPVSIEGQGHFLTLAQGCVHTKIQTRFSQKLLCQSEPNFV